MKRKPWVALVLAIGAFALIQNVIYLRREFSGGPRPSLTEADEELEEVFDDGGDRPALAAMTRVRVAEYLSGLPLPGRSPFLTRDEAARLGGLVGFEDSGLPRVDGTLWSKGRRVAWIDGAPYSEGDSVGAYAIERIEQHVVVMRRDGELFMLAVSDPSRTAPTFQADAEEESDDEI